MASENYNREWYEKNGAAYNEARKKRYKEDPEYRAKCIAQAAKNRAERAEKKAKGSKIYLVADVAAVCGVTVQTLKEWEFKGLFPRTVDPVNGYRVYTPNQAHLIHGVALAVASYGWGTMGLEMAVESLKEHWNDGQDQG